MSANSTQSKHHPHAMLKAIAALKLVKAVLMVLVALGAQALISPDVNQWAHEMTDNLQMRAHSHYIRLLLGKIGALQPHSLEAISLVAFGYAALLSAEGIGLWLEKRWAEYLTVVITVSLVPAEIYEIWLRATPGKFVVLGVNLAVVAYLVAVLRRDRSAGSASPSGDHG